MNPEEEPQELPIDGILDLHMFHPTEVGEVILAYIEACQEQDILDLRIIHGKGIGALRQYVHALLAKHPQVDGYALAPAEAGGWGATCVRLKVKGDQVTS